MGNRETGMRGTSVFGLSGTALDAAVATSFAKVVAEGAKSPPAFAEPSSELADLIKEADREETLGLLLHVLRRWHQLE